MANAIVGLREAGVPVDDLPIVVMRDTIRGEDHAVAAARLDGHWLMLGHMRRARGWLCKELPAFVRDRSIRRYEIQRTAAARRRSISHRRSRRTL